MHEIHTVPWHLVESLHEYVHRCYGVLCVDIQRYFPPFILSEGKIISFVSQKKKAGGVGNRLFRGLKLKNELTFKILRLFIFFVFFF